MLTLKIGNNVTSIEDYAFEECESLRSLLIGTNVTSIGYEAFDYCYNLTNAVINSGAIAEYAFEDCYDLTNLTLGNNVSSIGYEAFEDCEALQNLSIPNNVTSIGDYAFEDCYDLTNVTLGKGVTSLGYEVFGDCYVLTNVTFGPNVGNISEYAFYYCTNLAGLYFQGTPPAVASDAFQYYNGHVYVNYTNATVYFYAGAIGWGSTWDGFPTVELSPNSLQITLGPTAARNAGAQWQLDSGPYQNGGLTTLQNLSTGSHTVSFTPISGWNTPATQTVTISNGEAASVVGIYTPTNTPASGLVLLTNGSGTIQHVAWPKTLVDGTKYTVMAVPHSKNVFVSWTGGTNQPYAVLSTSASYKFTMATNLVLEANFVTNPFAATAGIYNGLFSTTNGVTEDTAGMLKNLLVRNTGAYSGTILFDGGSHGISGNFDADGLATSKIVRPASQGGPVWVELALDLEDSPSQVSGMVFGTNVSGTNEVAWSANLTAYLATNALHAAEYTMLIQPDANNTPPTLSPGGDGYALITNHAGAAKITGALADGVSLSQTVPVSQGSYVPIFASLYKGKGLLLGWLNLDTTSTGANNLTWIHPVTATGLYTNGFTNVLPAGQIQLALWTNPPGGLNLLTNLSTLQVINGTNGVTNIAVATTASGDVTATSPSVSGTIDLKTGLLKVTIGSGASKVTGYGAVLLNAAGDATNGGGYFLSTDEAQALELEP